MTTINISHAPEKPKRTYKANTIQRAKSFYDLNQNQHQTFSNLSTPYLNNNNNYNEIRLKSPSIVNLASTKRYNYFYKEKRGERLLDSTISDNKQIEIIEKTETLKVVNGKKFDTNSRIIIKLGSNY
jgi:hypothetical protein